MHAFIGKGKQRPSSLTLNHSLVSFSRLTTHSLTVLTTHAPNHNHTTIPGNVALPTPPPGFFAPAPASRRARRSSLGGVEQTRPFEPSAVDALISVHRSPCLLCFALLLPPSPLSALPHDTCNSILTIRTSLTLLHPFLPFRKGTKNRGGWTLFVQHRHQHHSVVNSPRDVPFPSFASSWYPLPISSAEASPSTCPRGRHGPAAQRFSSDPARKLSPVQQTSPTSAAPAGRPPSTQLPHERHAMDGRRPWPSELPAVQPTCAALVDDADPTTPHGVPPPSPAHPSESASSRWPLRQRRRYHRPHRHHPHPPRQTESLPPGCHNALGYPASASVPASQQPMESLVDKLTLEAQEEDDSAEWKASAPLAQDGVPELVQEQTGMAMDIDADQSVSAETATALPRSLEMMRMRRKSPRRDLLRATRPSDVAATSMQLIQPLEIATIHGSATAKPPSALERSLPVMALEPIVDMSLLELEADEGYCDGNDDMSWLVDAANMSGVSRTVRSNGVLKFRTSTEAALQCSMVVHKNPRMRRRRQKKLETRLKPTDTSAGSRKGPAPTTAECPDELLLSPLPYVFPVQQRAGAMLNAAALLSGAG